MYRKSTNLWTFQMRRSLATLVGAALLLLSLLPSVHAAGAETPTFREVPTRYIAALGEPDASSGFNAQAWGLWGLDPGPRGVRLKNFERQLLSNGGVAPAQWQFDGSDWWLEEYGRLMETPEFPMPPGKYIVTGGRETVAVLTIHPKDDLGRQRWQLGNGATLHDVTHLQCRSARYTPTSGADACSPANVGSGIFPVRPGETMPDVEGCRKQEYAVLFVIAEEVVD
jgi:hypothetical protein